MLRPKRQWEPLEDFNLGVTSFLQSSPFAVASLFSVSVPVVNRGRRCYMENSSYKQFESFKVHVILSS